MQCHSTCTNVPTRSPWLPDDPDGVVESFLVEAVVGVGPDPRVRVYPGPIHEEVVLHLERR